MMYAKADKGFLYLLLFFTIFTLLFLNKAMHIDVLFTLGLAMAISKDFINVPLMSSSNPILIGYYYAPFIRLFGENERLLHLVALPFSLLVLVSMYLLALRFLGKSILPVVFLTVSPAFVITSHSIMLDIPLLGFFLSALVIFIYGADRDNGRLLFLSVTLAGAACLIKYSAIMLVLIMLAYALLSKKRKACLFAFIPLLFLLTWFMHNLLFYRSFIFLDALHERIAELSPKVILIRTFACLSFLSGTSIITVFLVPFLLRSKKNAILLFASLPIALCPFLARGIFSSYALGERVFLGMLFWISLFIVGVMSKPVVSFFLGIPYHKDRIFLSLWFLILLIFTILVQFIAARFVLLLFPPMFLYLYHELAAGRKILSSGFKIVIGIFIATTVFITSALALADYHFAGAYRDFIASLQKSTCPDKKILTCHLYFSPFFAWGYAYYLYRAYPDASIIKATQVYETDKRQGLIYITSSESVLPCASLKTCNNLFQEIPYAKTLIDSVSYKSNIVLQNYMWHAGFYSHWWGLLPFYISLRKVPYETFFIYALAPQ